MAIWTVWIIASQDDQHLLEYDLMLRSLLIKYKDRNIHNNRYFVYEYNHSTKIGCIKTLKPLEDGFVFDNFHPPQVVDFYNNDTLVHFFQELNTTPTEKNLVISWGHGSGLGYFFSKDPVSNKTDYLHDIPKENWDEKEIRIINKLLNTYTFLGSNMPTGRFDLAYLLELLKTSEITKTFIEANENSLFEDYFAKIEERLKYISAENLSQILHRGFSGKKIDLLLTNCCYVQSLETNFFFKDVAKVAIAPQTSFPFLGYDFEKLFSTLEDTPLINTRDLAISIVNNFRKKYKKEPYKSILKNYYQLDEPYPIVKVSFSAIDLSQLDTLFFKNLNAFSEQCFMMGGELDKSNLEDAREKCKNLMVFAKPGSEILESGLDILIDLTYFVQVFTESKNTNEIRTVFRNYRKHLFSANSPRIKYLQAKSNISNPRFLSFMMLPTGGVPESKIPLYKLMIEQAYNNEAFKKSLNRWTDFLNVWNKLRL